MGFPKGISFPKADPICPGCAKGKMPSKSFPTSESHATKPFEKIHSNLKSFSVVSYHKHKYYISFVDDYSSYSWIMSLHAKSSAIAALKHFLAMVKNQFNTTIREWMSDAGGEYKSNEFLNALKDNGIKVLQSTPYMLQSNPLFPPSSNPSLVPPQQPQPSSPPWLHPHLTPLQDSSTPLPSS